MPFVNVPSTESADYINAQKSEFEDTYYVDNLNTLGAGGGGGGGIGYLAVNNCGWSQNFGNCATTVNFSNNDVVADVATFCSCSGMYVFTESGSYLVNYCETIATTCCAYNSTYACFIGFTSTMCSCSNTSGYGRQDVPSGVARLGVEKTMLNVSAGDQFLISFNNTSATATSASGSQDEGILTITKIA